MIGRPSLSPIRSSLVFALACMTLIASSLLASGAHAAITSCRSDPVIVVNGSIDDIVSILSTDPANIKELDYTIAVPVGSILGGTTLTVGIGFPEKVTYVFSSSVPWGAVRISASVLTNTPIPAFATGLQVTPVTSLLSGISSVNGTSSAPLTVALGKQLML